MTFLFSHFDRGDLPLAITKGQSYFLSLKKDGFTLKSVIPLFKGDFLKKTVISDGKIIGEKRTKLIISTEKVISYDFG